MNIIVNEYTELIHRVIRSTFPSRIPDLSSSYTKQVELRTRPIPAVYSQGWSKNDFFYI